VQKLVDVKSERVVYKACEDLCADGLPRYVKRRKYDIVRVDVHVDDIFLIFDALASRGKVVWLRLYQNMWPAICRSRETLT